MKVLGLAVLLFACSCGQKHVQSTPPPLAKTAAKVAALPGLPVYDHVVIVIEENKDYGQIVDKPAAGYINDTLRAEGASFTQMFAEEHHSEGNYFWLFSGDNQNVGFKDVIPKNCFTTSNLGSQLIQAGRSFRGYSEDLPAVGSHVEKAPPHYARKHVPWVSFCDKAVSDSSNLRFADFPSDYSTLPTVSFVIPNLINDMHDGNVPDSVKAGDQWLRAKLDGYCQWAKQHNSLLIVTFDEDDRATLLGGLTDPGSSNLDQKNLIATIFAGAHIKHTEYTTSVTHVNILRTIEAMYGLEKSGAQAKNAVKAGIPDDRIITDIFE